MSALTCAAGIGWDEPQEKEFAQETRIILASAEFSKELTTSVLWLNERDLDIRCVRLCPYALGDRILLNIEQVIPLPEANDYEVKLREKATEERQSQAGTSDWSRFDLTIKGETYSNLYKRRLAYLIVRALMNRGVTPERIMEFLPKRDWIKIPGTCSGEEFREKAAALPTTWGTPYNLGRYFVGDDELFHVNGATYAFTNQISRYDLPGLQQIADAFPEAEISFTKSQNS